MRVESKNEKLIEREGKGQSPDQGRSPKSQKVACGKAEPCLTSGGEAVAIVGPWKLTSDGGAMAIVES